MMKYLLTIAFVLTPLIALADERLICTPEKMCPPGKECEPATNFDPGVLTIFDQTGAADFEDVYAGRTMKLRSSSNPGQQPRQFTGVINGGGSAVFSLMPDGNLTVEVTTPDGSSSSVLRLISNCVPDNNS